MDNATLTTSAHTHDESCEPTDAWIEKVEHPAIGEPTIIVDNPDYVAPTYTPAHTVWVDPVYTPGNGEPETIEVEQENPAYVPATPETTEIIYHDAITATHWKYVKNGGWGEVWLDNNHQHKVKIDGHWYQRTSKTKEVTVKDAWEETITTPGEPAQGEPTITVTIDNPEYVAPTYTPGYEKEVPAAYTPAEGKPTIEIDNPDYVEAWVEDLHHDANVCEVIETVSPDDQAPGEVGGAVQASGPAAPKAVETTAATQQVQDEPQLAVTGGSDALMPIILAAAALAAGVGLIARKIVRRG